MIGGKPAKRGGILSGFVRNGGHGYPISLDYPPSLLASLPGGVAIVRRAKMLSGGLGDLSVKPFSYDYPFIRSRS